MNQLVFQIDSHQNSKRGRKQKVRELLVAPREVDHPLWISVSEAAKFGGVQTKTIRRAIESTALEFKVTKNRYHINLKSLIDFLLKSTKLKNKFSKNGLGQYIQTWKQ